MELPLDDRSMSDLTPTEQRAYLAEWQSRAADYVRAGNLAWAVTHLPAVSLFVAGGMIHAFARSTGAPLAVSERRAIVDAGRRSGARPAGGAR